MQIHKIDAQKENSTPVTNEKGGIAVPAILWMFGMPLTLVIVLWLLFFRG